MVLLDKAPQVGYHSFGAAAENDLAPNVVSIFPLGWFNKSLPVDVRAYDEFDFTRMRSLR